MGQVHLYFDTRSAKSSGKYPLKLCVTFSGTRAYLSTGIDLDQRQWNGKDIVKCDNKSVYTQLIAYKKTEVEKALIGLECRGIFSVKSPSHLKELLERQMSGRFQASTYLVRDGFQEKMHRVKESTRCMYVHTLDVIGKTEDLESFTMSEIDYRWLCALESRLIADGMKTNTISIHMRNIRAVFNHLIDMGDIEIDCYPFRKFKVKSEETRKRSLTLAQLRSIRDTKEGPMKRYADLFMLTFYLCGINIIDLCNLKEVTPDGRIEYRRSKTGRLYSIKVEPEAMAIIKRYRGKSHLIDILDRRKEKNAHKSFMIRMNKYLKTIIPGISTYWGRHSWATIAAELETPNETIAAALGHSFGSSTTAIYINFNQKKVDDANRAVIDYINSDLCD